MSFPANQDGLKAIDSLKEWLDKSKKRIEEDILEAVAFEGLLVPKKEEK